MACSSASRMICGGDAADLDVHLQGGDALARAGHLEVHVAVMVFGAGDVGQDGVLLAFLHQAHGDAGHRRRLIGTPASIRASEPPQTVAIDEEPFDSRMSETTRMA